ncbi:unnamed protein product [Protopolystoma xenopodis]|uniref:Uncharacterized protein n=1 Tax=Protopolystoma xenopodis TaxID=117903 RepID=A0A3S5B2Y9_9PLAT|nr:unnamed protein product [Protopolystoma xenopodis]
MPKRQITRRFSRCVYVGTTMRERLFRPGLRVHLLRLPERGSVSSGPDRLRLSARVRGSPLRLEMRKGKRIPCTTLTLTHTLSHTHTPQPHPIASW